MTGSILMIIGFVVGAAVASAIFGFVGAGRRKKLKAEASGRAEAQDSISALLADADAIEANFRAGALAPENFRRSLNEKVNAAMRQLRTQMHGMDVFFVKYAEMQVQEYMRVLENPERRRAEMAAFEQPAAIPASLGPAAPSFDFAPDDTAVKPLPLAPAPLASVGSLVGEPDYGFELPAEAPPSAPEPVQTPKSEPVAPIVPEPPQKPAPAMATPPPPVPEPVQKPDTEPELRVVPEYGPVLGEPVLGEPILGESGEDEFDLSAAAPAAPVVPPAPATTAPAADAWSDQSIEEFEAAFAQFEDEPATFEESSETGTFQVVDDAYVPEAPAPAPAAPPHGAEDEHSLTETSSIDKAAIMNALAAAQQSQTPQPPQSVHKQASVQTQQAAAQQAEAKEPQPEQQGITGDDVVDFIDSFFNLK